MLKLFYRQTKRKNKSNFIRKSPFWKEIKIVFVLFGLTLAIFVSFQKGENSNIIKS